MIGKKYPPLSEADIGINMPKKNIPLDGQNANANNMPRRNAPNPPLFLYFSPFSPLKPNFGRLSLFQNRINNPIIISDGASINSP